MHSLLLSPQGVAAGCILCCCRPRELLPDAFFAAVAPRPPQEYPKVPQDRPKMPHDLLQFTPDTLKGRLSCSPPPSSHLLPPTTTSPCPPPPPLPEAPPPPKPPHLQSPSTSKVRPPPKPAHRPPLAQLCRLEHRFSIGFRNRTPLVNFSCTLRKF